MTSMMVFDGALRGATCANLALDNAAHLGVNTSADSASTGFSVKSDARAAVA